MSDGTHKIRVWHAARDAYHCAFRLLRLLTFANGKTIEFERLRILDLFLLAPSQLHRVSMPMETKAKFRSLDVPNMEEIFSRLPSVTSMFQQLRIYQTTAASYLVARDIVNNSLLRTGLTEYIPNNVPTVLRMEIARRNDTAHALMRFLLDDLAVIPLAGADNLYKRAGLPRRHLPGPRRC
jgi:hypothetical protein